jgi:hypothetical protein
MHGFPSFECLAVQMWIFRRNSNKRTKYTSYRKHFYNCPKMVHVGLHSVGTYHKKFGWENKKNKNVLCRVSRNDTRQRSLCRVSASLTLGKEASLPSANARPSAKVNGRQLWMALLALCRVYSCAESPMLGKRARYWEQDFAECGTRQRVLCRVPDKKHSTKRRALGKGPDSGSEYK